MTKRTMIVFKIKDDVVATSIRQMDDWEVQEYINMIASEMECTTDDVYTEVIKSERELSDFDLTPYGLVDWKDMYCQVVTGVTLLIDPASDEFIDKYKNAHEYLTLSK